MQMNRLKGKVIAIAGGAGGIGSELSRRFAREGAAVVVGDINLPAAEALVAEIAAEGGQAVAQHVDIGNEADVNGLVARAVETFGGLDGFHANAADFRRALEDTDAVSIELAAYDHCIHYNQRGFLLCTRAAIPALLNRGGGAILYTSSGSAHAGEPVRPSYAMAKSAIHALMRHVASRWGREGIRANVIAPGVVMHPTLEAATGPQFAEWAMQGVKGTRLGRPEDIAAMAALLLSDEGGFVTGQVISVDGGGTIRP
jgi:NAD(P)-dependent dehydrogenase (short-subunit alcohol dehydrogenase family)